MLYKKLISLSLVGMLSFGVLVGCESENQEVKGLQEQAAKLEQQTSNQKEETKHVENKEEKTKIIKDEEKKEIREEKQGKFYVGKDGLYHCEDCEAVPSKEEYNNNICNLCEHYLYYGNCDDCGKERLKEEMTLEGGQYHCGCTEVTFNCAYCGKLTYGHQTVAASYCSQECLDASTQTGYSNLITCPECGASIAPDNAYEYNGADFCMHCYNDIINEGTAKEEGSSICIGCGRNFVGSQTGYCNEYECAKKSEATIQKDYIEMLKENATSGDNNAMLELANQGICPYCFSHNTLQTFSPDSLTCYDCGSCY